MSHFHAVVWTDPHSAQVLQFDAAVALAPQVRSHVRCRRQHGSKTYSEHELFDVVCDALAGSTEVLVAGSHVMQTEFRSYVHEHRPEVATRIVGWQTLDRPTANELVALARRHFSSTRAAATMPMLANRSRRFPDSQPVARQPS